MGGLGCAGLGVLLDWIESSEQWKCISDFVPFGGASGPVVPRLPVWFMDTSSIYFVLPPRRIQGCY